MAFLEAYLAHNSNLIADTGAERIDLTPRSFGEGWDMTVPNDSYGEMQPFTTGATYRVPKAADWAISPSGLYYAEEVRKVDAVRSTRELFVLGLQGSASIGEAGTQYYFLAMFSVLTGMPKEFGEDFVQIGGISFLEAEASVYGTEWSNEVTFSPSLPTTSTEANNDESLTHDWALGPPVIVYDISEITAGASPVLKAVVLDGGGDRFEIDIPIDATTPRASCGLVDFASLTPAAAHTGSRTEWPDSTTQQVHIRAANMSALTMRFGVGYRQVTER